MVHMAIPVAKHVGRKLKETSPGAQKVALDDVLD